MKYTDYPELSDDEEEANEQVEQAYEVLREEGVDRAFRMAQRGELKGDAIQIALGQLEGEVEMLRESPKYPN